MLVTLRGPFHTGTRVLFERLGYHLESGFRGDEAYVRRMTRLPYPRFHLYPQPSGGETLTFRIHLDQKRPSYAGTHAHGGEYEGAVLEDEVARIRNSTARFAV